MSDSNATAGPSLTDLQAAAAQGDPAAQDRLGLWYEFGTGVTQDLDEALRWYRAAAEQGHAGAQYHMGLLYHYGKGSPPVIRRPISGTRRRPTRNTPSRSTTSVFSSTMGWGWRRIERPRSSGSI